MFVSWKTSLAGIAAILTGAGGLIHNYVSGETVTQLLASPDVGMIITGLGLLVAKDWNVTGGTKLNSNATGQNK